MTTSTGTPQEQLVQAAVREISHIATLPEVTTRIVDLVEDPRSTAQDLHRVVSVDPALCSRILRIVNSSFYGLPGQIGSVNRAIVLLGLNAVKNIAIAASLAKLFRGSEITPTFSARDLWVHSAGVAVASKVVADQIKIGLSDEAFLAGLIHDIGIMVELQLDRAKLVEVVNRVGADSAGVPANDMLAAEQAVYGATHPEFGAALCERWRFPQPLRFVAGFHHRPAELAVEHRTLPSLVYVADRLTEELKKGFRLDLPTLDFSEAVLETLKITPGKLDELRQAIVDPVKNAATLLS
ncbi:MAG: HDOD domain-containing protein [Phycisphaerae bacterium]|nr:HDOD domain-containing protein [Phycisphaerae bacterium]